ncbi:MAG: serine/threonine-protein kinase [Candidatus Obscuribacter sp.]|nr:serine/threonine-protein kinase [Candidatus Obscuribacter sp.]
MAKSFSSFENHETASIADGASNGLPFGEGDILDGTYILVRLLGSGAMGAVYEARHQILNRPYAIKILMASPFSQEAWKRFQSEGKALARLNHPGIVGVHNMGVDKEQFPYYVMDLLSGTDLARYLKQSGPMPVAEAAALFQQLAEALSSAHKAGIIHRDIKPSNIIVQPNQRNGKPETKLVDFGIARLTDNSSRQSQNQTATGLVFGTPYYMSPEQGEGLHVDERADIYSLGCTLFEALTGRVPFAGENAFATIWMHQTAPPPSLAQATGRQFPQSIENCLKRMLAKAPAERYQSAEQLAHDLSRIARGKTIGTTAGSTLSPETSPLSLERSPLSHMEDEDKTPFPVRRTAPRFTPRQESQERQALPRTFPWQTLRILLLAVATLMCITMPLLYFLPSIFKTAPSTQSNPESRKTSEDLSLSSDPDLELVRDFTKTEIPPTPFLEDPEGNKKQLLRFPDQHYFGYFTRNGGKPQKAQKNQTISANDNIGLYLQCCCTPYPKLLNHYSQNTISTLEMPTYSVAEVCGILGKDWSHLEHLCFYNSLIRHDQWDESIIKPTELKDIDKLTKLKSLGLCSQLDGADIARMKLLNTLTGLKLKKIQNLPALLECLNSHPQLTELTLVKVPLNKQSLELLRQCRYIKNLTIMEGEIGPEDAISLSKMKAIHSLRITSNWNEAEKNRVKRALKTLKLELSTYRTGQYY